MLYYDRQKYYEVNQFKILNYQPSMADQVTTLITSAFTNTDHGYDGEAELTTALREGQAKTFEIVALYEENQVTGHALLSEATVGNVTGLVLAPLSVQVEHQHQGIGSGLMKAIEEVATQNDYSFISILGYPDYYQKFGYVPANEFNVKAPMEVPNEFFLMKILQDQVELNGTLKYAHQFGINN